MLLSRKKPVAAPGSAPKDKQAAAPSLDSFLEKRDYTGALSLLEFNRQAGIVDERYPTSPWLAFCAFHLGDYKRASDIYLEMLKDTDCSPTVRIYLACCYFYLGYYDEAEREALSGPSIPLRTRILFHIAHKKNSEADLMKYHAKLQDTIEDQLCLASIHYMRNHFQEATDVYKRILMENKDFLALNVYIALCYYKLDYYDVSLEVLNVYLQSHPDSAVALNLKACNQYRLYDGKAAEMELKALVDLHGTIYNYENDLVRHNMVVFRDGENALAVLPALVDVIPEARLNLVIHHIKHDEIEQAYELMKDVEPSTPSEFIVKGVINTAVGQATDSAEHLKLAQHFFQVVGTSASECDTIPGRQCMASCFYLLKQFDDVLTYLKSVKAYFYQNDDFNWNYGIALASTGHFQEAEEVLTDIRNEKYKKEFVYLSWLARCYVMNSKPRLAWDLYLKMETSSESFNLLQLIANDCYRTEAYFYSAKAFDVLERLDPAPEYWDGKRGACVGVFQHVMSGHVKADALRDVLTMLSNSTKPEGEKIAGVIRAWANSMNVKIV
eukprot:TRINITY_DN2060_c0_g1_i1.p1 TRINITY_DN2060_c0_g1~~TRINITY_DN2060_c0_g1_i1.p1  ORF type:complete len:554 (+),score=117.21 TRINITY_DN2060_c0_g1_i1:117-1778(+)